MIVCVKCDRPVDGDVAHQAHDGDCARFAVGTCTCDGWLCPSCCPDTVCVTPRAAYLQLLNHQHRESVLALEDDDAA